MKRKCLSCGAVFDGRPDAGLCPACAKKAKSGATMRVRICRECGGAFVGGPRAWYCPACRAERKKVQDRAYHKNGPARRLGSTDICPICGRPYTVKGGNQRYCPDCAHDAIAAIDRQQALDWYHAHADPDRRRAERQAATAEIPCAVCGRPFRPGSGSPVTCSPACAAEYRRRCDAAYQAAHRERINQQHRDRRRQRIAAMSADELAAYKADINQQARERYRLKKTEVTKDGES